MLLTQSLVEYGLLSTLTQTIQHASYSVQSWLASLSSTDWAVAGGAVIVGLTFRSLRRSR